MLSKRNNFVKRGRRAAKSMGGNGYAAYKKAGLIPES